MIYWLLFFIAIFVFVCYTAVSMDELGGFVAGICGGVMLVFISACIVFLIKEALVNEIPSALDVYRNKTTLQITYKDSVAVDSMVVFKDEYLKKKEGTK